MVMVCCVNFCIGWIVIIDDKKNDLIAENCKTSNFGCIEYVVCNFYSYVLVV